MHQRAEKRCCKYVTGHSLGMPLHADHPMFMRLVLDGFNHAIGSDSRNAQAVPKIADGLMMRCVHLHIECAAKIGEAGNGRELSEFAARGDSRGMDGIGRIRRKSFFAVFDVGVQFAGNVLIESAAERDVQALAAVADGENGFAGSKGVVENCEISFFAIRVGIVGLYMARGVVERWIHVGGSAGEDKSVQVFDLGGELVWG